MVFAVVPATGIDTARLVFRLEVRLAVRALAVVRLQVQFGVVPGGRVADGVVFREPVLG
jgi:hypothetical protein